jgi:exodeoxyribonuclease V gamma subunit
MSGLHVYRSNRTEALVAVLAERLRGAIDDPFRPIEVVVGSRGMERHLRHALAEKLHICANMEFPFPAAAIDDLLPGLDEVLDPWSTNAMTWALLEVLPACAAAPGAEPLRRYLGVPNPRGTIDARTWGLARRIADLFDSYITYRPGLITNWAQGSNEGTSATIRWQPLLWRALSTHIGPTPHRAERFAGLDTADLGEVERPLYVFGLSTMAKTWLDALSVVARRRPVDLFLLCPSNQYWGDVSRRASILPGLATTPPDEVAARLRGDHHDGLFGDAGHPLLASWGRLGRDMQIMLESLPDGFDDGTTDLFPDPRNGVQSGSALSVLQSDIISAGHPTHQPDHPARILDPNDRSIQIHCCHGPTRQVEVLRTVLLELLDDNPDLQPRDIVVMTPDIDAYAPLIGAVFESGQPYPGRRGWDESGSPKLPWALTDLAVRRLNPVADALLRVLAMVDGRVTATEVIELLTLEPVSERFKISPDDLSVLRGWVHDVGIRWGVDEAHREEHNQPADIQNTWRFGLDRLLMGVVMPDDGRHPAGVRPFESVEGGGTRLIGRFTAFCAALFDHIDRLKSPRTLLEWARDLTVATDSLTATSGTATWLTHRVRAELTTLKEEAEAAKSVRMVSLDALRASLTQRFEVASTARHGRGGAITFSGMQPERAVPFRVVCLLGMDEGTFPRNGDRPAFDIMRQSPRVGDRNVRDEDRYLLLEAVLSARTHLMVFYTGRDVRTNEVLPPAVPVSELQDALDATWPSMPAQEPKAPRPSALLTRVHALQAFDARDFDADSPFSYDVRLLQGVRQSVGPRTGVEAFLSMDVAASSAGAAVQEIRLRDLVGFWRHPIRAFLQRALRIRLTSHDAVEVADREPIELGWLDNNRLLEALVAPSGNGQPLGELRDTLRGAGELPLGGSGDVLFESMSGLAATMHAKAAEICGWRADALHDVDIDLTLPSGRLGGRIADCSDGPLVLFRHGEERGVDLLDAWLRLLTWRALDASAPRRALVVFGRLDTAGREQVAPIGLEVHNDDGLLDWLFEKRNAGLRCPLPFFPKSGLKLIKALLHKKSGLPDEWRDADRLETDPIDDEAASAISIGLDAAMKEWLGGFGRGEGAERYNVHAFGDTAPFWDATGEVDRAFLALSFRVWEPIVTARRTPAKMRGWGEP